MFPTEVAALVFFCTFGAVLAGMRLRRFLPEEHLRAESKEAVTVAIGLVATMTALVLGLVTASAKSAFDGLDAAVKHTAADVLTLDRTLARYGPESEPIREALKHAVEGRLRAMWPSEVASAQRSAEPDVTGGEHLVERIRELAPRNDEQRWLRERAMEQGEEILGARWMVFSNVGSSVPVPFLTILIFWLAVTFASFGLYAPWNGTVVTALLVCTLSVAAAIFLILEMDGAFEGVVTISPDPLRYAIERLDR